MSTIDKDMEDFSLNELDGDEMIENDKPTVVVTGFGPFRDILINPSWTVVQELQNLKIKNAKLEIILLPVEYHSVLKLVPKIWKNYKPKLVIHCGFSCQASTLVLEKSARNESYMSPDVVGNLPPNNCCYNCAENCLDSKLDLDKISQDINQHSEVMAAVSTDAGRYLCEFTYFASLAINQAATAFIHIPPLDKPYSSPQLAKGLQVAISSMLQQLSD